MKIINELKHHLPFTALATIMALIIILFIQYSLKTHIPKNLFEVMHFIHIFASSMITARIFHKYNPKLIPALLIGISGSIIIGSLSDIIFPYLGGNILNLNTSFHLPIIENTYIILMTAIIGSLAGILKKITLMPHFIHVFLSVFASLFYLLAFSQNFSFIYFIGVFLIVFIAVIIPCCISDILFPLLFIHKK